MEEPTNQPNITGQDEAHIAKDDWAIMRLAVDLAAKCVSEENRVSRVSRYTIAMSRCSRAGLRCIFSDRRPKWRS